MKPLVGRGKPSTMVTAREACRDEKVQVMHCTSPCVQLMDASEYTVIARLPLMTTNDSNHARIQSPGTARIMPQNSKMLHCPCIFSTFFRQFSKYFWLNGRSSHLIEAAKRGRLDQVFFFSAPLTTRAPPKPLISGTPDQRYTFRSW